MKFTLIVTVILAIASAGNFFAQADLDLVSLHQSYSFQEIFIDKQKRNINFQETISVMSLTEFQTYMDDSEPGYKYDSESPTKKL